MSTVHGISRLARKRSTASEQVFMAVKGSPQEVLQRCAWYLSQGKVQPMTQKIKNLVGNQNELMTGEALRVLGFAFKKSRLTRRGKASELAEDDLIWLGLVGMSDPPRAGVRKLIGKLQTAGIRPVMVTGDQGSTAVAIGKRLGLAGSEPLNVIESTRLEKVAPEVFSAMARQAHVFARVSPAHKLQIVQALQKQGNRVAMTGDGINDGPALKASHIGIAMGAGGTDVARKVADVVLMKDDLSSIVTAIREGRVVHENMRKATDYIVAQNLAEILLIFLSVASGLGEPLNPLQLLWVNLITDIFPELALAQEKPEKDILTKQPVAAGAPILPAEDIRRIILDGAFLTTASLGGYLYGVRKYGRGPQASTLAFVSINTASLFYTITARSKKVTIFDRNGLKSNPFIPAALGVGFSAEYLGAFLPVLRGVLGTARVQPLDLLLTAAGATLPLFGIEIIKFITSRLDSSESGDPLCKANMFSTQSP
jgi:Ca2+-transporting ATPase